jgi:hypothetical protein
MIAALIGTAPLDTLLPLSRLRSLAVLTDFRDGERSSLEQERKLFACYEQAP